MTVTGVGLTTGMTTTERRIAALTTGQLGAFSRAQATDAGLSNRQLRSRVMSGALEQTGPNSFRVAGTPNTLKGQLVEVLLDIGGDVRVCGPTAAALHGMPGFSLRRPLHVSHPTEGREEGQAPACRRCGRIPETATPSRPA